MNSKYYIIPSKFDRFEIGSILRYENDKVVDMDSNIELIHDNNIPDDWITILSSEMKWLLNKSLAERLEFQKLNLFKQIKELKIGDKCFYRTFSGDAVCTIAAMHNNDENNRFKIKFEDNTEKDVTAEDIELFTDASRHSQEIEEIILLLHDYQGDIQKLDNKKRSILSLAYKLSNKSYFKMFLETSAPDLDITKEHIQTLLRTIVKEKQWQILELVIKKCNVQECNNAFLMNLSIEALREGNYELLVVIFRFATKIVKLDNGETFLTNLFKENIDEATIKKVIEYQLFDVNLTNDREETPLTLACERLFVDVVKVLLLNGANAALNEDAALERTFDAKKLMPDKVQQANTTKDLLKAFKAEDVKKNVIRNPKDLPIPPHTDVALDDLGQKLLVIMKQLVLTKGETVALNDKNVSVLTLSYDLPNKRLFNIFVHKKKDKFDLLVTPIGQGLLTKMVDNNDMVTLKAVLDKLVYNDDYEIFLLNLALTTLIREMKEHYKMIVDKCKNKNRQINSGEIFLTLCFKKNVKETLICDCIKSDFFDLNQINANQESPLMLACERLMGHCVELLLSKGSDKSYKDYNAVDIVVAKGNATNNPVNNKAAKNFILDLMCVKNADVKDKLQFTESGLVDLRKISTVVNVNLGFKIGDSVVTKTKNDPPLALNGKIKWLGIINDQICVGIELDDPYEDGFDGKINDDSSFVCAPGHGILTTIDNVKINEEAKILQYLPCGIVDASKYLDCHQDLDQDVLKLTGCKINDIVNAHIQDKNHEVKLKGVLQWLGYMNGVQVGIVKLDNDYQDGTNGQFWRHQLIECPDKRAIALKTIHISKWLPFTEGNVPKDKEVFSNIDVNSRVTIYVDEEGQLRDLHGRVRWIGFNSESHYVYGIELDNEYVFGTDGEFEGQRLFTCPKKHGIIRLIDATAPQVQEIIYQSDNWNHYTIPHQKYTGKGFGIHGHRDSSFLDCLIFGMFAKSSIFDYLIDAKLNETENYPSLKEIREILSFKIVYPLRKFSFVSFQKIQELRLAIRRHKIECDKIINPSNDLEKFATILHDLSRDDGILSFITSTEKQSKDVFVKTPSKSKDFETTQHLLDMSMVNSDLYFLKDPKVIILKVPIQSIKNANKCLPLESIEISHLCWNYFKKCSRPKCRRMAKIRCKNCADEYPNFKSGLLCGNHDCKHGNQANVKDPHNGSRSIVQLFLKSIICFDNGHSVTYVKENDYDDEWIYFNDGSNLAPPTSEILRIDEISVFLKKNFDDMANDLRNNNLEHIRRITENSHIFIYTNPTQSCY